jgi:uncharacterized RDD family membrane protein YckC
MNAENPYSPPRAPVSDPDVRQFSEELAGRGARLGAFIIDSLLLGLALAPLVGTYYGERAIQGELDMSDALGMVFASLVGFLVLNGYLLHKHGQTIGKRLLGIRIVSASDGQLVALGRLFGLRYVPVQLVGLLPFIGNFLWFVDALFIFREDRRCLHDLIAGTKVVKA